MGELLFSLTRKDFEFDYFRGSGKGGQKRNKTSSGVRCTHPPSGAVGVSDDTRDQHRNKKIAFERMSKTPEFQLWWKKEVSRRTGEKAKAWEYAEKEVNSKRTLIEIQKDGRWVPQDS